VSADLDLEDMPDTIPDSATPTFITSVTSSPFATTEITELVTYADSDVRITINETIAQYQDLTFGEVAGMYDDIRSLIEDTSPTFDDDSDVNGSAMDFSNIIETVDQNRNEYWYEDSDAYLLQIT
jgi:hypothetical protein